ncbi:hypothetical protein HanIR_Chr12g0587651 [Helianthus annuus]|nr:hypothetical protein HanIR_Chr12g0587651 [Helianthus annuus]
MEAEVFGSSYFVAVGFGSRFRDFGSRFTPVGSVRSTRANLVNSVQFWSTPGQLRTRCTLTNSRFWNDTTESHFKLALHRNIQVAFLKLRNGWNRGTHGNSST